MRYLNYWLWAIIFIAALNFATTALTAPAQSQTRIETDQKTGVILFIVNGREEARITSGGLKVRKDVRYGGAISDAP